MEFEVVVVGASSAGLYAAQLLAQRGIRVGVFERDEQLETSSRTLIVTPAFSRVLNSGTPEAVTSHRSGTLRITSLGQSKDIKLSSPDSIVDRAEITRRLYTSAASAGARLFNGYRFRRFATENGSTSLLFSNGDGEKQVKATRGVVGADGAFTKVGLSSRIGRPATVPILQGKIALPGGWNPDVTQVWFNVARTRYFYWLIPESNTRGVAGLVGDTGRETSKLLHGFLSELGVEAEHFQAGQVAMYNPRYKPWGQVGRVPVMLVGDAAGQVKVTTVGGTVPGLIGARAAARAILHGRPYRKELFSLRRELDLHWWTRWALHRLDNQGYDDLIRNISAPLSNFFAQHDRDSLISVFWKLPFLEPRLIRVGIRCIWGNRMRTSPFLRQKSY